MRQTVQENTGQPFVVGEDLGPIGEGQIRRHYQAGLFVALAEETEQMLGPDPIQRDIAQFIDHDQVATPDGLFQLQDRSFLPGLDVSVYQL